MDVAYLESLWERQREQEENFQRDLEAASDELRALQEANADAVKEAEKALVEKSTDLQNSLLLRHELSERLLQTEAEITTLQDELRRQQCHASSIDAADTGALVNYGDVTATGRASGHAGPLVDLLDDLPDDLRVGGGERQGRVGSQSRPPQDEEEEEEELGLVEEEDPAREFLEALTTIWHAKRLEIQASQQKLAALRRQRRQQLGIDRAEEDLREARRRHRLREALRQLQQFRGASSEVRVEGEAGAGVVTCNIEPTSHGVGQGRIDERTTNRQDQSSEHGAFSSSSSSGSSSPSSSTDRLVVWTWQSRPDNPQRTAHGARRSSCSSWSSRARCSDSQGEVVDVVFAARRSTALLQRVWRLWVLVCPQRRVDLGSAGPCTRWCCWMVLEGWRQLCRWRHWSLWVARFLGRRSQKKFQQAIFQLFCKALCDRKRRRRHFGLLQQVRRNRQLSDALQRLRASARWKCTLRARLTAMGLRIASGVLGWWRALTLRARRLKSLRERCCLRRRLHLCQDGFAAFSAVLRLKHSLQAFQERCFARNRCLDLVLHAWLQAYRRSSKISESMRRLQRQRLYEGLRAWQSWGDCQSRLRSSQERGRRRLLSWGFRGLALRIAAVSRRRMGCCCCCCLAGSVCATGAVKRRSDQARRQEHQLQGRLEMEVCRSAWLLWRQDVRQSLRASKMELQQRLRDVLAANAAKASSQEVPAKKDFSVDEHRLLERLFRAVRNVAESAEKAGTAAELQGSLQHCQADEQTRLKELRTQIEREKKRLEALEAQHACRMVNRGIEVEMALEDPQGLRTELTRLQGQLREDEAAHSEAEREAKRLRDDLEDLVSENRCHLHACTSQIDFLRRHLEAALTRVDVLKLALRREDERFSVKQVELHRQRREDDSSQRLWQSQVATRVW